MSRRKVKIAVQQEHLDARTRRSVLNRGIVVQEDGRATVWGGFLHHLFLIYEHCNGRREDVFGIVNDPTRQPDCRYAVNIVVPSRQRFEVKMRLEPSTGYAREEV